MTQLPRPVHEGVAVLLERSFETEVAIHDFSFVGGGCINHGGKLKTEKGNFFLKWNDAHAFPGMFETEALGLNLLAKANAIRIPATFGTGENGDYQFILLEHIESSAYHNRTWHLLGTQLAALHKTSQAQFGLDHDNYMGSLRQYNDQNDSWINFFIHQRLEVQLKVGVDSGAIDNVVVKNFEKLYKKLPSLLTTEKPSLVHGDLWGGNLIIDEKGSPCLIDPAVYYGHREIDLAMTQLFGVFNHEFYDAYLQAFPVEPGLQDRLDIYNLYPLLVHVNLFGQNYLYRVNSTLSHFI